MLVLSRQVGERIRINDDIQVMVVGVRGKKVRLGVSAPADTPVHRAEVYDRIHGIEQAKQDIEKHRPIEPCDHTSAPAC